MATITDDFTFNVAKGKVAAYFDGDISGFTMEAVVVKDIGTAQTDQLRDADTLAAALGVAAECDFTNYDRKPLQNISVTVNDTDNSVEINCDDWSYQDAGGAQNNDTGAILFVASSGTDGTSVPVLAFIYEETTTGSTLNILVPQDGFYVSEDAA